MPAVHALLMSCYLMFAFQSLQHILSLQNNKKQTAALIRHLLQINAPPVPAPFLWKCDYRAEPKAEDRETGLFTCRRSSGQSMHFFTDTAQQIYYIQSIKGIRLGSLCMHSRSHNNAVRAWKDEEPAWRAVLGELISLCVSVCI